MAETCYFAPLFVTQAELSDPTAPLQLEAIETLNKLNVESHTKTGDTTDNSSTLLEEAFVTFKVPISQLYEGEGLTCELSHIISRLKSDIHSMEGQISRLRALQQVQELQQERLFSAPPRIQSLSQKCPIAFWTMDHLISCNQHYREILGYGPDDDVPNTMRELSRLSRSETNGYYPLETEKRLMSKFHHLMWTQDMLYLDGFGICKDGSLLPTRSRIHRFPVHRNNIYDISELYFQMLKSKSVLDPEILEGLETMSSPLSSGEDRDASRDGSELKEDSEFFRFVSSELEPRDSESDTSSSADDWIDTSNAESYRREMQFQEIAKEFKDDIFMEEIIAIHPDWAVGLIQRHIDTLLSNSFPTSHYHKDLFILPQLTGSRYI